MECIKVVALTILYILYIVTSKHNFLAEVGHCYLTVFICCLFFNVFEICLHKLASYHCLLTIFENVICLWTINCFVFWQLGSFHDT